MNKIKVKSTGTGSGYIQTWIRVGCNPFWGSVTMVLFYSLALQLPATSGLSWWCVAILVFWSRCGDCVFALKPESYSCAPADTYKGNEMFLPIHQF